MFVRWEQDKERLTAVLIETTEVGGQSQERIVRILASIKNEDIHSYWGHMNFWKDVSSVLEDFPDVTREEIVAVLSRRIKPIPNWAIAKMETILDEYHQRGESILQALHEENQRHEIRLAEITLQGRKENAELEERKISLLHEIGLNLASKEREMELKEE